MLEELHYVRETSATSARGTAYASPPVVSKPFQNDGRDIMGPFISKTEDVFLPLYLPYHNTVHLEVLKNLYTAAFLKSSYGLSHIEVCQDLWVVTPADFKYS